MVTRFISTSGRTREGGVPAVHYKSYKAHVPDERHDSSMIDIQTPLNIDGYAASGDLQGALELIQDSINSMNSDISALSSTIDDLVEQQVDQSVAAIQIQNWFDSNQVQVGLSAEHAIYAEESNYWVLVGTDGYIRTSTDGRSWSSVSPGFGIFNDFTYVFDVPVDGYNRQIVLDKTDDSLFIIDGDSATTNVEQTSGDTIHVGVYDPVIEKAIVVGKPSGGAANTLFFGTSSVGNLLVQDMDRVTGQSLTSATVVYNMHMVSNGNGRVLCLIGYKGTLFSNGRTDMFIITKNTGAASGISVAKTVSIGITTGSSGELQVTGVAYDEINDQWVAATLDGRIWTSPVGDESWTLLVDLGTALLKFAINDILWVSVTSSRVIYSVDAGETWRYWDNAAAGTALAFSNKLQQWLIANGDDVAVSLSVNLTPNLVT